jgi:hypothetical protein
MKWNNVLDIAVAGVMVVVSISTTAIAQLVDRTRLPSGARPLCIGLRFRRSPVADVRSAVRAASYEVETQNVRPTSETDVARTLSLPPTSRQVLERVAARILAIARAVAADHALALRAAAKAASPRRNLIEVRAMYLPHRPPTQNGVVAEAAARAT